MAEDVAKLEAELTELLEAREAREGEDDSSVLAPSSSELSEDFSGSDLSDISATGKRNQNERRGRDTKPRRRRKQSFRNNSKAKWNKC